MSLKVQTCRRLLGAGLALLGLGGQALAQQEQPARAADSITVVRDAETGKLRDATPAERAALQAANARRTLRAAPQPVLQKYLSDNSSSVIEGMKPLIREWMDEHVPALLEGAVRAEVERVVKSRGAKR